MSKLILLLFGIAVVAVVQALPHGKPCYGGGGGYPRNYQPYPYQQQPPETTTAAPVTAAPTNGMQGPPLSPTDQATLNRLYAAYVAASENKGPPLSPEDQATLNRLYAAYVAANTPAASG